ncbi:MAG: penicillin-binding protein 2 [Thermovirgaceae bacterium]|nr:penicillin-binding protein 2 [Synergistales bacterium]NLV65247.1 penicillin-binding protein 2 [Synergistaceae bacterium]HRW87759.1 penicillin-binding protein 2 [Thermovirgaceae bacterium]MDD3134495.1 penicillin-binding protein 2 [Synergistales bacterium]MDD3830225.1 penicillin-binding protein 2 [Synergistales bacterium]
MSSDRISLPTRLNVWRAIIMVSLVVLVVALFRLQVLQSDLYVNLAARNRLRLVRMPPARGRILDVNGTVLATNVQTFDLMVYPLDLQDKETAEEVSRFLKARGIPLEVEQMLERVRKEFTVPYRAVTLLPDLTLAQLSSLVSDPDFPRQLFPVPVWRRVYPAGPLVAHVLGYVGEVTREELERFSPGDYRGGDHVGKGGVEEFYESVLRGTPGQEAIEVDARGRKVKRVGFIEPGQGEDLELALDLGAQRLASELMAGRVGAVFAMDVHNGNVKVLFSSPNFDANPLAWGISSREWNELMRDPVRPMLNRVIAGTYPPASTFKVVPAFAALAENAVTRRTTFTCTGGMRVGNRFFRCWKRDGGHGPVNVVKGLRDSCDVFFYQAGLRTGIDALVKWGAVFGVGEPTGIDLPGEARGNIAGPAWKLERFRERWYPGDTANYSIGQGFLLLTPIQLARIYAAIANGGKLVTPRLLKGAKTSVSLQLPEGPLAIVKEGIEEVVLRGTGRRAGQYGVSVAGKTGTAENPHGDDHAWFVGYAPVENPRYVAVALVEAGLHGSSAAGPVVGELLGYLCRFD